MISFKKDGIEYRLFDHLFAVSRCGKVLRKMTPYIPRNCRKDGYLTLGRMRLMHRVIAICWIPNPENAKHVHHINGDKADNRSINLEWVTPKQHFSEKHDGKCGKYKRTESTRQKYRDNRLGKKDSEEVKTIKRAILLKHCPKSTCKYNGIEYPSISSAARAAGIPAPTFRVRCLSKNFPEYELVSCFYR